MVWRRGSGWVWDFVLLGVLMTDREVLKRIERILAEYNTSMGRAIKASGIRPTDHFCEDLGGDSLDLVSMIIAFEEEFGIEIQEEDFAEANPWVVGNLVGYIQQKNPKGQRATK